MSLNIKRNDYSFLFSIFFKRAISRHHSSTLQWSSIDQSSFIFVKKIKSSSSAILLMIEFFVILVPPFLFGIPNYSTIPGKCQDLFEIYFIYFWIILGKNAIYNFGKKPQSLNFSRNNYGNIFQKIFYKKM